MTDPGDEILAKLLQEHGDMEATLEHWHTVGRMIGSVYVGMVREGVDDDQAITLTSEWMECHLFDRIEKLGLRYQSDDDSDDEETPT